MTRTALLLALLATFACSREQPIPEATTASAPPPSILLVTLDTTRADSIGPEANGVETPAFNALAARGRRFLRAYAPTPQTLPSHTSMMTGLYPAGHGIHENARYLNDSQTLLAESLREAGYRTAAFVSAYPLARQFGLARGFDLYDDGTENGRAERSALETTDRALAFLQSAGEQPLFLWVHYFDPHHPYEPPEPFRSRYATNPYLGEIAAMDEQMGRLVEAFERRSGGSSAILIAGDHGESLGEHGESQHGNLIYEGAMRVPLVIAGPGVPAETVASPVSIRRIFHTVLDWSGIASESSLRAPMDEVVLGEAMQPFLQFGWQPQVIAVEGSIKAVRAGGIEVYDLAADPGEMNDLGPNAPLSRGLRAAIRDYPIPTPGAPAGADLDDEGRRQLASLGYVTSEATPVIRPDAPKPRDMAHVFDDLERASTLFVRQEYAASIPIFERILAADPGNVSTALRIAAAHSALGNHRAAMAAFRRAEAIAPESEDVRHFMALHYLRTAEWERAEPLLERVLAASPERVPAIEGLATVRERQGRLAEALALWQKLARLKELNPDEWIRLGEIAMGAGRTDEAITALERARGLQAADFRHHLELGVLYLAARRPVEAREALDRVPRSHPGWPMALFKRAQVSVLLGEPDRAERIRRAREAADATTAPLIARERLFE
jgi:choline-sulfatase